MWSLFIFTYLLGLQCTVSTSPPSPVNVSFTSVNLRNVLHWFPGHDSPHPHTLYTVEYAIYGDSIEGSKGRRGNWRAVRQCTEIVRTWCDLSQETFDEEQGYYARVRTVGRRASSKWALTRRRFDPKSDTTFGPPLVSVEIENNSAIITLKGPMRYPPNNHTPARSMASIYPHMTYNLSIHNTHRNLMHHFSVASSPHKYYLMAYDTEYCFSAQSRFISMPVHSQSSPWLCITTPQDPVIKQLQRVIVGTVVPFLCICVIVVAGYLLYHYLTGKGEKSPYILNPPSFHPPPLTFPPENLNLFLISVINDEPPSDPPSDPKYPQHQLRIADAPPAYASQGPEAPSELEEPWDDSSIDYGFVSMAPQISVGGEDEARDRRQEEGDDGNSLKGELQKCIARAEDGHAVGLYAPQEKSYLTQQSTHTSRQTHMPTHAQDEMSAAQAHAWSAFTLQSSQGSTMGEVNRKMERIELQGLFISRNPQTGQFHVPLNLQAKEEVQRGEEVDGKTRRRTDQRGKIEGGVEEGSECEIEPLLSPYASQNIQNMSTSNLDQPDFLSDDYGVLTLHETEEDDYYDDEEEEDEGTICINWDPETRKLVLPEIEREFRQEERLDGPERGWENRIGREDEEGYVMKGELRLENVFVRQGSEEEAEAQRELENRGQTGWEVDDLLTKKWNLVISSDQ